MRSCTRWCARARARSPDDRAALLRLILPRSRHPTASSSTPWARSRGSSTVTASTTLARALVVTVRVTDPTPELRRIVRDLPRRSCSGSARRRAHAQPSRPDGYLDRRGHDRRPLGPRRVGARHRGDHAGGDPILTARALARVPTAMSRSLDVAACHGLRGARCRPCSSTSTPADGAPAVLRPTHARCSRDPRSPATWPWPETRLTYANAVLPEAMIVIGDELGDDRPTRRRPDSPAVARAEQTVDGHLSLVPSVGRPPGDHGRRLRPAADRGGDARRGLPDGVPRHRRQRLARRHRPVRRLVRRRQRRWRRDVRPDHRWRLRRSRGARCNQNQGAESTLAWLSTLQISDLSLDLAAR